MKIQGDQSYLQVGSTPNGTREIERPAENKNGVALISRSEDTVLLSPQARQLKAAREAYDALPGVRSEKVAELKEQILNGTYRVRSGKIAWKMIQESLMTDRS